MNSPVSTPATHRWRFFRIGGFDQVALDMADDLRHLDQLDPKLWTALGCPSDGLEFDSHTLALLDSNGDGNIRVPEVLAAVRWACRLLKDPQSLFAGGALALSNIHTGDEEGAALHAAARQVLAYLGKPEADTVSADDFADMTLLFQADQLNGDGIVTAARAAGEGLDGLVGDIITTQGGVADRSGEPGVNADTLAAFFEQAQTLVDWRAELLADPVSVLPLGEATAAAAAALVAVEAKVDDFFTRCRLAAYDARAAEPLNPAPDAYGALAARTLAAEEEAVAAMPLATIAAGAALPLGAGLNPAWATRLASLQADAVTPLLGARDSLTAEDWAALRERLALFRAWQARQPDTALAALDADAVAAALTDGSRERLMTLVDRDSGGDANAATVDGLRQLAHYQRDLVKLLRNFVNLSDFYTPGVQAIFQAGTLYLDQRSCELVLRVADAGAHAKMAPFSGCYLVYCVCERAGEAPLNIVAALTGGSVDELMVPGRHGVFYDRQGRDWKTTITKVVEQPVSVRQAFFAPYRRLAAFIENQIRNFAAARDKDVDAQGQAAAAKAGEATAAAKPEAAPAFDIARFAGIFAALGLAVGALGTALAAAVSGLFQLAWWQFPLVFAGVALVISGPSMLMAWLTLRRRNLGPLLDANGWAVNARARINIPFGASLTGLAELPAGASRSLSDPYADKPAAWPWWLAVAVLLGAGWWAWQQGWLAGVMAA
jgi:hypothetical protein